MSFGHCSCPDCGTTLRIRDRTFVGRTVQCPECHVALVIELDRDEQLAARKPPVNKPVKSTQTAAANRSAVKNDGPRAPTWTDALRGVVGSPLVMAWALGLAVTALVVVAMLRPALRFSSPGRSTRSDAAASNTITPDETNSGTNASLPPSRELPPPKESPDSQMANALTPANVPERPVPNPAPPQQVEGGPVIKPVAAVAVKPDPVTPAPPPKIDFDLALKLRLDSIDQSKPVSRRELLEFMEEMIGAPIRYDAAELGEKNLDKQVTFKMENPTLGGLLKSILDPAGWMFVAEETQLRVKLKPLE